MGDTERCAAAAKVAAECAVAFWRLALHVFVRVIPRRITSMASPYSAHQSIYPHPAPPPFRFTGFDPVEAEPTESSYVLLRQGTLEPGAFERASVEALEIIVSWGSTVLCATHLCPPRAFAIGEANAAQAVDFTLPAERLGSLRAELIELRGGVPHLLIPAGASARLLQNGESRFSPCAEPSVALLSGTTAEVALGDLTFRVATVRAGQITPRAGLRSTERSLLTAFGASFAAVAMLIGGFAFWTPGMGLTDGDELDSDRVDMLKQYLTASAEREDEAKQEAATNSGDNQQSGAPADASRGPEGQAGKPGAKPANHRMAVAGDTPNVAPSRAQALDAARHFGMVELVGSLSSASAGMVAFGRDVNLGNESTDAMGHLFGDEIGEAGGNGLRLSGLDNGGGGHGDQIGMGGIGTCAGLNCGTGMGPGKGGFGGDHGRVGGDHKTHAPKIGVGVTQVSGRLPPEVVQRIVRQNYGRFRMCYETGLQKNPNLEGRVAVRFVIGRDGAVANAQNGGSDLPDAAAVSCIVSAFYGLSFPTPENGIVSVSYPIMFSPG